MDLAPHMAIEMDVEEDGNNVFVKDDKTQPLHQQVTELEMLEHNLHM